MRRLVLLAAILGAWAFAACGGDSGSNDPGDVEPLSESPLAIYRATGSGGDDAALRGTLLLEDDCLYVVHPEGRTFLVFPEDGLMWDGDVDPPSIFAGGKTYRFGTHVELAGSAASSAFFETAEWVKEPDPACDTSDTWVVSITASK